MKYFYIGPNKDEVVIQEEDLASLVAVNAYEWARRLVEQRTRCAPDFPKDTPKEWRWDDPGYSEYIDWVARMNRLKRSLFGVYADNRDKYRGPFHIECVNNTYNIVEDAKPEQKAAKHLPSSMKELAAYIAAQGRISKFDFGSKAIPRSGPKATAVGARKAWKYVVAYAIARALIAREYGVKFTTADIAASCLEDWKTLSYFKHYCTALPDPGDPTGTIAGFMDKEVDVGAKYLSKFSGNPWCAAAFITWLRNCKYNLVQPKEKDGKKKKEPDEE